ncbi:MAG TPA: cation-translocating P-type ATPase [Albitalea sp.]|nr:cation-translocating P-type ATPase [Albitalea sp.]
MTLNASATLPELPAVDDDARLALLDDPQELASFTRFTQLDGQRIAVSTLQLSGLYCAACAGVIESALRRVPGVADAQVNAAAARAEVRWDPQRTRASALVGAITRAGYGAAPDAAAPQRALRAAEQRQTLWRLFVAGFCMMQVMMYATPAYVAAPGEITPDLLRLLQWAGWLLSLPVVLFSSSAFFAGAWRGLRVGRIGMDVPVALGIAVTFVASSGATFDPGGLFGSEVYFDSLAMFVFFLLAGRTLELRARHRVADSLEGALQRLPDSVQRLDDAGGVTQVSVRQLRAGDRVRVLAGQAFPADGTLLEGSTQADEALLTGEAMPVPKHAGDALVAGSLNLLAPALMRVERLGADTRYEGIVALMRGAFTQRPAQVRVADRLATPFLWGVLLLAAGAAAVWSVVDPARAVWVAVSVLIVTCPCALSLAAPSALLAATGALARRGVLLQRIEALEVLAAVDWLFVDKTGTLTEDRLALRATHLMPAAHSAGLTDADVLRHAASLARQSIHPLSRALAAAASQADAANAWTEVHEIPGAGLQARAADGTGFRLGSLQWVQGAADALPDDASGGNEVWFGPIGQAWARFEFAEVLRSDAAQAIARLQRAGVHVALLSGDQPARVAALAWQLAITDVHAAATPEGKLDAVAQAQAQGHRVAMVGDGLNDAPVLARADVSFAFAHGAAVSKSRADAVVLSNRLSDVADARELAQRTLRVVRQNLAWAVLYNAACIPLALLGLLPPWAAGLGMASSSLFVVLNALRLSR